MYPQARKRFAQHWLRSETVLDRIVEAAALEASDRVLEIGPGTGILTQRLQAAARSVVAVEIDRDLCARLTQRFGKVENFLLLQGDILALDFAAQPEIFPDFFPANKVVANIPYNITGPILKLLLGAVSQPKTPAYDAIVLLVQKEVGDRLTAQPNSKTFGALTVRTQYLAECETICDVPAIAFVPPPKVDSAVVRLRPRPFPVAAANPRSLETLIKLGFGSRRKMLRNNLKGQVESDRLTPLLEQLEINPTARAEQLSVEQWVLLSNNLSNDSQGE